MDRAPPGQDIDAFRNTGGERRYITGIKMRGKRMLILRGSLREHAAPGSRQRHPAAQLQTRRRSAPPRSGAVPIDTVNWLVTQLPPDAQFQIYGFNTKADAGAREHRGQVAERERSASARRNVEALARSCPQDGTSLVNAFAATKQLTPLPDQIILITDGLPTQGKSAGLAQATSMPARARACSTMRSSELPDKRAGRRRAAADEGRPARRASLLAARALHATACC